MLKRRICRDETVLAEEVPTAPVDIGSPSALPAERR
jgi:hypothetical protein